MKSICSDIEIAQGATIAPIEDIAARLGLCPDQLDYYGKYKAKVCPHAAADKPMKAKLILVTAMSPTPAGEGKTTTSVGLADGLRHIGKEAAVVLREPSLGPVFGMKGGAAGGGYAQVIPMEDINLHFTGDLHAISAANNLLAAMLDNHIYHGNALNIDPRRVQWRRCLDMNDRQLRNLVDGLGGKANGMPREDGFDITAASEVMAALCMADCLSDLKERLGEIIAAYTYDGKAVHASDLQAHGAMAALLKDALRPNLVQTLEGTPALIHGGPFANIAHGCNSVTATLTAMKLTDYVVTEAGFGADLGAEKFLDIKCRRANIRPDAVVIVATVKALKYHGGVGKGELGLPNIPAVEKGMENLYKHIENITKIFRLPAVVAINRFASDSREELLLIKRCCAEYGVPAVEADMWAHGGAGGAELAQEVVRLCEMKNQFSFSYETHLPIKEKLHMLVTKIYGANGVEYTPGALKAIDLIEKNGYAHLPLCVAKTQYSFSDDPRRLGRPVDFPITVRDLRISAGAGFIVVLTGEIMTMPGLPACPAAQSIDIDENGRIEGLF